MKNADRPAYPVNDPTLLEEVGRGLSDGEYRRTTYGITKREVFAMAAMQGLLGFSHDENVPNKQNVEYCAKMAVVAADLLLKELENIKP